MGNQTAAGAHPYNEQNALLYGRALFLNISRVKIFNYITINNTQGDRKER